MSTSCDSNCAGCADSSCGERTQESLIEPLNDLSHVKNVIAVVSGKGGVGKTTFAATLARLYAAEGRPVLAADVDPDANLGLALGFDEETLDSIDEETLITIRTFFENNLNLSETSRQLYVHRNTLVYRFEKLQRKFGLDIRAFEDALTFKLAMMVVDYIKYSKNHPS